MNTRFLTIGFRVWLTEIVISAFNYFVLMDLIWEPLLGELHGHQVGMTTRIGYIFGLSYLILRSNPDYTKRDLIQVEALWLASALALEWLGSILIQRRSLDDILVGWRVWEGYMWPYVLLAYAWANYIVGTWLRSGRPSMVATNSKRPHGPAKARL